MSYRHGNREQIGLFPPSIEEYVKEDDPVRAYDAIVESFDFSALGIELGSDKVGCPQYDPKAMLKLLVYGYSYGVRSSRKLERAVYHNVSFIWLMGGLKPDHKTIAEFRRKNKKALRKVLKQCARLCIELDLIAGNTLFVDGSKIRANASIKNTWDKKKCEKYLKKVDKRIEAILSECDEADEREEGQASLVEMEEELKDKKKLKSKVEEIVKDLEEKGEKSINTTDSQCTRIKGVQGTHAGYNAQAVVDEKHGLIVASDVVSENNDLSQFANQVDHANETLGRKCEMACGDSGYADTEELEKIDKQEIKVIVPSQRQASRKKPKSFDKENFRYDKGKDCYICPEGHLLEFRYMNKIQKSRVYVIRESSLCSNCRYFGLCTKAKTGRTVSRLTKEELRERLEAQYEQPESQKIYKLRMQRAEVPFGHIKRNLEVNAFLVRGLDGVKAEMSLLASCFNISRMITILGVEGLVKTLAS
jgi:transposase